MKNKFILIVEPAIAAMHGPHSLVRFGDKVRNKLNYRIGGPIR